MKESHLLGPLSTAQRLQNSYICPYSSEGFAPKIVCIYKKIVLNFIDNDNCVILEPESDDENSTYINASWIDVSHWLFWLLDKLLPIQKPELFSFCEGVKVFGKRSANRNSF